MNVSTAGGTHNSAAPQCGRQAVQLLAFVLGRQTRHMWGPRAGALGENYMTKPGLKIKKLTRLVLGCIKANFCK